MQKQPFGGFFKAGVMGNFAKSARKYLCRNLFFDKVKLCRPANSLKTRFQHRYFLVNLAKLLRTFFLQNTTGRLLLIIVVLIVAKGNLSNKTINYDKMPKYRYQFGPRVQVIKNGSSGEKTIFRSSRLQMFCKIGILKNFTNSTVKHLCWSPISIKFQP